MRTIDIASMMNPFQSAEAEREEGLSLVEMIVAIMVFAIVALSAYPLFIRSVEMVSMNNLTTTATVTVNSILEDIRQNPTCVTLNRYAGSMDYTDERGMAYSVSVALDEPCEASSVADFDIKAVKTSNSKTLLEQRAQVLVPPRNGVIELD